MEIATQDTVDRDELEAFLADRHRYVLVTTPRRRAATGVAGHGRDRRRRPDAHRHLPDPREGEEPPPGPGAHRHRRRPAEFTDGAQSGVPVLEPGQVDAVERLQTRFFVITGSSKLAGRTVGDIDAQLSAAAVEAVVSEGATRTPTPDLVVSAGDIVVPTGDVETLESFAPLLDAEVAVPRGLHLVEEQRDVVIISPDVVHRSFADLCDQVDVETRRCILPRRLTRMAARSPCSPMSSSIGATRCSSSAAPRPGSRRTHARLQTDRGNGHGLRLLRAGIGLGMAIGLLSITVGGVPADVTDFLRDFGLAVSSGSWASRPGLRRSTACRTTEPNSSSWALPSR